MIKPTRTQLSLMALILIAFTLTGCGRMAKNKLVGLWQGALEIDDAKVQAKLDEAGNNPLKRAAAQLVINGVVTVAEAATLDFELKSDGSYTSTVHLGIKTDDTYGTWEVVSQNGNRANVKLTPNNGIAKTTVITFVDNDTFTVALGEAEEFGSFRCKRQTPQ